MAGYRVISSDSHVFEPGDLWTDRIETRFRDHAPRIVRQEDGSDWWVCDGVRVAHMGNAAQTGVRFEESGRTPADKLSRTYTFEQVRPGAYDPEQHVKDMDADGIDASIVYPTAAFMLYNMVPDSDLLTSLLRTYNDWLREFCSPFPNRLKGIPMLNVDDVHECVRELERCAKMGFVGALITVWPLEGKPYSSPEYEPLWAAAHDLGMPLSLHVGTNRPGPGNEFVATQQATTPSFLCNVDHWVRMSLGDMIFSGVFERHPALRVGSVEMELSWAVHFLDRLDYTYTQRIPGDTWYRFKEDMLPSDYFHRNIFLSFQGDATGVRLRDIIGVDNLLWGSDYPHPESTFPRSRQILEEVLADCTEEEKAEIAGGNAARIYRLD